MGRAKHMSTPIKSADCIVTAAGPNELSSPAGLYLCTCLYRPTWRPMLIINDSLAACQYLTRWLMT